MTMQARIESKLAAAFAPDELAVVNESHMHSVPAGSETHFKVLVVSGRFEGLGRVDRHRRVHDALRDELTAGVHALALRVMTPGEFARAGAEGFVSPRCMGGSKSG
jgi:stress-induced morphogen